MADTTSSVFSISHKGVEIGTTRFEHGDPPMGVVTGILQVSDRVSFLAATSKIAQAHDDVEVRESEDLTSYLIPGEGSRVACQGSPSIELLACIVIDDYPTLEEIHITVITGSEDYDAHFMHHRHDYENRFKTAGG